MNRSWTDDLAIALAVTTTFPSARNDLATLMAERRAPTQA